MKEKEYFPAGNMLYPVPAVLVSVRGNDGRINMLTVAWTGTVCSDPPMLSISVRPERFSYELIRQSGEFVVNLVTEQMVPAADYCGVRSGADVDKFAETGLTPVPSREVSAPGIGESPVNIECRVKKIIPLGSHDLFLAEVAAVSVDRDLIDESGKLHLERARLAAYSHGVYWSLGRELGSFGFSVRGGAPQSAHQVMRRAGGRPAAVSETGPDGRRGTAGETESDGEPTAQEGKPAGIAAADAAIRSAEGTDHSRETDGSLPEQAPRVRRPRADLPKKVDRYGNAVRKRPSGRKQDGYKYSSGKGAKKGSSGRGHGGGYGSSGRTHSSGRNHGPERKSGSGSGHGAYNTGRKSSGQSYRPYNTGRKSSR
jgi:flavin reductase (DIM6/NTAB) family NADH-FMN oxidoreductase RutF